MMSAAHAASGAVGQPVASRRIPRTSFSGSRLELNLNASKGSVRVELLDGAGRSIANYGRSDPLTADALRATVSWKGNPDFRALAGKPVSLRFHLQQAELYSFAFRA